MNSPSNQQAKPRIGIITALSKEYAALTQILENTTEINLRGQGAGHRYLCGEIPTKDQGKHRVVLCLASMGNNIAGIRASLLLNDFQDIKSIIMVGIAGGIPYPEKPDDHVRLGDIVISDEKGVIQYDFDKETITETIHRHPPRPPSASLIEGVRLLEANELLGKKPWLKFIDQALLPVGEKRPSIETDILVSSTDPNQRVKHPQDPKRKNGKPRVFIAPIASANKLLKNPIKRDMLRDKFGVKAVEMEGSGIADATWNHEIGYLVVRGICDYCDSNKGDNWQAYAAAVAAAYTRALLEAIPCLPPPPSEVRTILTVEASPVEDLSSKLNQEIEENNRELHSNFRIENRSLVDIGELSTELSNIQPEIVHFCEHSERIGEQILVDQKGETQQETAEELAKQFQSCQEQVKCVICFSDVLTKAISRSVDYVIGMRQGIGDETAIKFSRHFYDALDKGKTFNDAFVSGYNALTNIPNTQKPFLNKDKVIYDSASRGLRALTKMMKIPEMKLIISTHEDDFQIFCKQIKILHKYKLLHDLFLKRKEGLQTVYEDTYRQIGSLDGQIDWDLLSDLQPRLQKILKQVEKSANSAYSLEKNLLLNDLINDIKEVQSLVRHAIEDSSAKLLSQAFNEELKEIIDQVPVKISNSLCDRLSTFPLRVFIGTLDKISRAYDKLNKEDSFLELEFKEGIAALKDIEKNLTFLVNAHNDCQTLDYKLNQLKDNVDVEELNSLKKTWSCQIGNLIEDLCQQIITDDTISLNTFSNRLLEDFHSKNYNDIMVEFDECSRKSRRVFNQIDGDLLAICKALNDAIGKPLEQLIGGSDDY